MFILAVTFDSDQFRCTYIGHLFSLWTINYFLTNSNVEKIQFVDQLALGLLKESF